MCLPGVTSVLVTNLSNIHGQYSYCAGAGEEVTLAGPHVDEVIQALHTALIEDDEAADAIMPAILSLAYEQLQVVQVLRFTRTTWLESCLLVCLIWCAAAMYSIAWSLQLNIPSTAPRQMHCTSSVVATFNRPS